MNESLNNKTLLKSIGNLKFLVSYLLMRIDFMSEQGDVELAQKSDTLCGGSTKSYQFSLVNAGEFEEKYALSIKGPSWAELSDNFVSLEEGDSIELSLDSFTYHPKELPRFQS